MAWRPNRGDGGGGGPTVIEDWESGSTALNDWGGDTGNMTVQNESTLEGSWLVENGSWDDRIGHSSFSCSRGNTYRCRIYDDMGSGNRGRIFFIVGGQDATDPYQNCYMVGIHTGNSEMVVYRQDDGGTTWIADDTSPDETITDQTEYWLELEYAPTGDPLVARCYNASGTVIASAQVVDDTHTGGTVGLYNGVAGGAKWDYFTEL